MQQNDYDEMWAAEWDDMKKYGPYARHIRRLVLSILQPLHFSSVLDVGCGQGALLQDILRTRAGVKPSGVDLSLTAVELARRRIPDGRFSVLDISAECLPEQFDLVTCIDVLEHLSNDESAIDNIKQMTGGAVLVSSVQGRMRRIEPTAWGHVRNYAKGELREKLERAGLSVLKVVEWGYPFYSPLYRDFNNLIGGAGTGGHYGPGRKLLAQAIYTLFLLNSSRKGDIVFILACK